MRKTKYIRSVLALFVCMGMLLTPNNTIAAQSESPEVIYISSAEDLVECFWREHIYYDYALTNDIDISGVIDSVVGRYLHGTFDGNGYTISGLHGERPLFEQVVDGTLKNLTIDGTLEIINPDDSGYVQVGGICTTNGGIIENCVNSVDITSNNVPISVGGIAEQNCEKGIIRNCRNEGSIYGKIEQAGGIVAVNWGIGIADCENAADIIITTEEAVGWITAGGIIGYEFDGNHGEPSSDYYYVSNCKNYGDIRLIGNAQVRPTYIGGVIGTTGLKGIAATSAIINCQNFGDIYGYGTIGGVIGYTDLQQREGLLNGEMVPYYGALQIEDCWNTGTIVGRYFPDRHMVLEIGGVVGELYISHKGSVNVNNSHNSGTILKESGEIDSVFYVGGIAGSAYNNGELNGTTEAFVNVTNCQNKGYLDPQADKVNDTVASSGGTNIAVEEKAYVGDTFKADADGNLRAYSADGTPIINQFVCDGKYTYYFQADGTAMKNRLTYHPDGDPKHVIYFDEYGHEVFSDFANVKKTIEGKEVDDYCFFDVNGYLYVDVVTYDKEGKNLYYANPYGVMDRGKWFEFSETVKWADGTPFDKAGGKYGYANENGTLLTNTWTTDWQGRQCYLQGNGVALY